MAVLLPREIAMKAKLLILDDDETILALLQQAFAGSSMELFAENNAAAAINCIMKVRPNVVLMDIRMPLKSGLEILQEALKIDHRLAVIIMTDCNLTRSAIEYMKCGAYDLVTKPFDTTQLKKIVQKALENNLLSRKVRFTHSSSHIAEAGQEEDLMVGSSPAMMEIWKMVGRVADSDAAVLITGESGTGKELLARSIYSNSVRRQRQFLAVNCAALPETLLESELFGHEKGAFTDAHCLKIGKFEQCNGGTIFLDEIGEMSLVNQGKLLRVLETQEFERLGGNETIKVDVRIIAATNQNLLVAVKEKRFRLELFYRLRVITFALPPLRERPEDIPLLADLYLRKYSLKNGKAISKISPQALEFLINYPWEGNIRELQNAINAAVVMNNGALLLPDDFTTLKGVKPSINGSGTGDASADCYELFCCTFEPLFERICKDNSGRVFAQVNSGVAKALITMAMAKCNQNQVLAAKILGISRTTLRNRLDHITLQGE